MPGRWGEAPFAALTPCLAAGIVLSTWLTAYIFAALAVGTAALAAAALLALLRDRRATARFAGLAAVLVGGLMLALARRDGYALNDLQALLSRSLLPLGELTPFEGCVADQMTRRQDEVVVTIAVRAFQKAGLWLPCRGGMILRMPDSPSEGGSGGVPDLRIGDRVRGWVSAHVPRNYQNPGSSDHAGLLLRRGISLIGRARSPRLLEVIPGDCATTWTRITDGIRRSLRRELVGLRTDRDRQQSAILASLVLGDYSELGTETREVFQNSGTYHVLVVSGLHVAWIAAVLLHLFRWIRLPQGAGRILVAALLLLYTGIIGFQASLSRALWMFILYLAGQACFRRAGPANVTLASAFTLLAVRPDWLFDIGFQLSFLSVLAICLTGIPLVEQYLKPLFHPLGHAGQPDRLGFRTGRLERAGRRMRFRCELLAEACGDRWHPRFEPAALTLTRRTSGVILITGSMIAITLSVQAWLEPVLAYHFNRLSWIAPAANLVAVPLSSLVLAAGMSAALAPHFAGAASLLLGIADRLSATLLLAARIVADLPGAWQRCPTPPLWAVLAGIVLLFAWQFMEWRGKYIPWLYVGLLLFCLSTGAPRLMEATQDTDEFGGKGRILKMTFLDVGEGDSIVIRSPDCRTWVVDAGGIRQSQPEAESETGFDVGEAVVSRYLWYRWTTSLDRVILSHPDQDHAGGMPALLRNFRAVRLNYGETIVDPFLARVLRAAGERGTEVVQVRAPQILTQDGLRADVVNPLETESRSTNENSVVLRLNYGRFTALLTGDLEKSGEREFVSRQALIRCLLLKVAHHGSRNATGDRLLDLLQPRWAVLSSGRNNPFGHPAREVVLRLLGRGIRPFLTQDLGAITFSTDGNRYLIASHVAGIIEQGVLP